MGATPYCDLRMRLDGMPQDAYVQCTGWDCAFTVNSSQVSCPTLRCTCPNGCIDGKALVLGLIQPYFLQDVVLRRCLLARIVYKY